MTQPPLRQRYAIDFSIDGDLRYLAHSDMVRLFARACARSGLPASFTAGFNPHMRISLPFPRPVGQASDADRVLMDMTEEVCETDLLKRLQPEMPSGLTLFQTTKLERSDSSPPVWVKYRISSPNIELPTCKAQAEALLVSEKTEITRIRHKDGKTRTVNIRPFIDTIAVDSDDITVSVNITNLGAATPTDVCRALGIKADEVNHLTRRLEIRWQKSQPNKAVMKQ